MNLKLNEIENWYKTLSGKINSELIIRSVQNFFNTSPEKNILYFKKVIKPTENEKKDHSDYLKSNLKKNFFN